MAKNLLYFENYATGHIRISVLFPSFDKMALSCRVKICM